MLVVILHVTPGQIDMSTVLSDWNNVIISKRDIVQLMRLTKTNTHQSHRLVKETLASSRCGFMFVLHIFRRGILKRFVVMATLDIVHMYFSLRGMSVYHRRTDFA